MPTLIALAPVRRAATRALMLASVAIVPIPRAALAAETDAPAAAASAASSAPSATNAPTLAPPERRWNDYALPMAEIIGFDVLVNRFNHAFGSDREDYAVTAGSIRRNLRSSWGTDNDPFAVNQLGHPYQGSMYYAFARSAGFNFWESAGYTFAGSAFWEIFGETTRPSRNDQVASGIGGTFLGEALFRMSNLLLEQGGGMSRPWREAVAALVSPSTGFNRLVFGDRFGGIFSSRGASYYSRSQIGYVRSLREEVGPTSTKFDPNEAQVDFAIDYGLPGNKSYEYTRPFDYFSFQATASSANGFENVLTRGLLVGKTYEAGPDYRGVWGIYGNYDYISPQTFQISTTGLSLGTTAQWWLARDLSLEGTGLFGLGYSAVGTAHSASSDRDYNYGVTPQALLSLRLTYTDRAALELTGREYFVSKVGSGTSGGHDNIARLDAALTVRIHRQHAVSVRYLGNRRDASFDGSPTSKQVRNTVGLFYTLLGQDRFGGADWR
jgi:hypothetical protein